MTRLAAPANYQIVVDAPSHDPALGFDGYSAALAGIVRTSEPRFAIGIYGRWGSGKTTLMNAIDRQLTDDPNIAVVRFSAWRYEREEHLIVPLLDHIREVAAAWGRDPSRPGHTLASKLAQQIARVTKALMLGFSIKIGIPGAIEASFDANKALTKYTEQTNAGDVDTSRSYYFSAFEALRDAFTVFAGNDRRRIVVFVDDLDRCLPSGALELLESMKLFFDLDGFVFIVGVDRAIIELPVDYHYQGVNASNAASPIRRVVSGEDYVQKMFQVPFALPDVPIEQIDGLIAAISSDGHLPATQSREVTKIVAPHARYLAEEGSVNPRTVKRYLNDYTLQRKMNVGFRPNAMLTLMTLRYRLDWRPVYDAIRIFRKDFLRALDAYVSNRDRSLISVYGEDLQSLPPLLSNYLHSGPGRFLLQLEEGDLGEYLAAGSLHDTVDGSEASRLMEAIGTMFSSISRGEKLTPNHLAPLRSLVTSAQSNGPFQRLVDLLDRLEREVSELDNAEVLSLLRALAREYRTALDVR